MDDLIRLWRVRAAWVTGVAGVVCLVIAGLYGACGCGTIKNMEAETAYTAAQLACVDNAKTLAESKACRARVDTVWDAGHD